MIKPAWYVITEFDYHATADQFPALDETAELIGALQALFHPEQNISAQHTATAMQVLVRMTEQLTAVIRYGQPTVGTRDEFARLLHGINLVLAGLTQGVGRLTHDASAQPGLAGADRNATVQALAAATGKLSEAAGYLKDAYLQYVAAVGR